MGKIADATRNLTMSTQQRRKVLTLDKEFDSLEAKVNELESEKLHLEKEVNPLKREVERLKKQVKEKSTKENFTFDAATATYADKGGTRYCPRCYTKDSKRSPMRNDEHGWTCPVCATFYLDPSRPRTIATTGRGRNWATDY